MRFPSLSLSLHIYVCGGLSRPVYDSLDILCMSSRVSSKPLAASALNTVEENKYLLIRLNKKIKQTLKGGVDDAFAHYSFQCVLGSQTSGGGCESTDPLLSFPLAAALKWIDWSAQRASRFICTNALRLSHAMVWTTAAEGLLLEVGIGFGGGGGQC